MDQTGNRRVIALEEHYLDPAMNARLGRQPGPSDARLADFAGVRLSEMREVGIDLQVLSHAPPGLQGVGKDTACAVAREVNDRLHRSVAQNPAAFAAFAALPTAADGEAAADELERAVVDLGFKGAMINGMTDGLFHDEPRFWPIFRRAEALGVPIYIHPADPHPDVVKLYYGRYADSHPMFTRAAWGFTVETGTQAIRLVLSGLLDECPRLQLILGHLGEAIPFLLMRISEALARDTPMKDFRAYFSRHFHVTTSGFFSDAALDCCIAELGAERILFSIDWPYASNAKGCAWINRMPLSAGDRHAILCGNAERLLGL